jgi:hypothetical protein
MKTHQPPKRRVSRGTDVTAEFPPLTLERAEFLREKAKPFLAKQPGLAELRSRLLALGGHDVVWVGPEEHLDALLDGGRSYPRSRHRRRFIEDGMCHSNTAFLWYKSAARIRIVTGYALSDDGLWFQHSWGVDGGRIVETTSGELFHYFGIELAGEEGLGFFFANATPRLKKRFNKDLESGTFPEALMDIAREVSDKARSAEVRV